MISWWLAISDFLFLRFMCHVSLHQRPLNIKCWFAHFCADMRHVECCNADYVIVSPLKNDNTGMIWHGSANMFFLDSLVHCRFGMHCLVCQSRWCSAPCEVIVCDLHFSTMIARPFGRGQQGLKIHLFFQRHHDCGFTTTLGVRLTPVDWNKIHDEVRKFNVDTCDKEPLMTFILSPFIAIKTKKMG